MKYIIFEQKNGLEYPVIFPDFIGHRDMALKIGDNPISAGFCEIINGKIEVKGFSTSLNLESREHDNKILGFGFEIS